MSSKFGISAAQPCDSSGRAWHGFSAHHGQVFALSHGERGLTSRGCAGNLVMSAVAHATGVSVGPELRTFGLALYGLFAVLLAAVTAGVFAVWRRLVT